MYCGRKKIEELAVEEAIDEAAECDC